MRAPLKDGPGTETPKPPKVDKEKKPYNYLKQGTDWPDLYEKCKNKTKQSPINIVESEAIVTENL